MDLCQEQASGFVFLYGFVFSSFELALWEGGRKKVGYAAQVKYTWMQKNSAPSRNTGNDLAVVIAELYRKT